MVNRLLSEHFSADISQNLTRQDLRPSEAHNTGYPIEQHDRATLAAAGSNSFDLEVPGHASAMLPEPK